MLLDRVCYIRTIFDFLVDCIFTCIFFSVDKFHFIEFKRVRKFHSNFFLYFFGGMKNVGCKTKQQWDGKGGSKRKEYGFYHVLWIEMKLILLGLQQATKTTTVFNFSVQLFYLFEKFPQSFSDYLKRAVEMGGVLSPKCWRKYGIKKLKKKFKTGKRASIDNGCIYFPWENLIRSKRGLFFHLRREIFACNRLL